ncbi:elongation factor [Citrus sinensis]|uniref:Elongation factor n=1 Tax=Citrus sinensis TaxID=2711 RepID=A0ACB8MBH6_CITSI|nr:elongation factor [Citrus sinensis]
MDVIPGGEPRKTIKVEPDEEVKCVLAKSEETSVKCLNDHKESKDVLSNGQTMSPKGPEDVEVDIVKFTTDGEIRLTEAEDPDATEYSSSFGNTEPDTERCSGLSEVEVESQYFDVNGLRTNCDSFGRLFQMRFVVVPYSNLLCSMVHCQKSKKKLTNHWRSFIRPLMWRCKWAELRINEIQSQALKYARELAAYDQNKLSRVNQSTVEEFGSKSLAFSSQWYRKKAMKRRKRKRAEDTTDLASYMSHHSLFSYLENKRSNPDGNSTADDFGNTVIMDQPADCNDKFGSNEDALFFELKDDDSSLEQVLLKIETVHSRVRQLKSQLDIVMAKNASRFSSSENLSLLAPCDGQTSSAPSPTFSAGNADTTSIGAIYNPTQHISEYDIGDLVLPESAISSYAETIHVPDIIESTVGLLSAADVTFHQPQIGDSCEDILDNILIENDGAEGEQHTFLGTSNQSIEKHNDPEKGEEGESTNPSPIPTSEPDPVAKSEVDQDQSTLKSCLASDINFPRNKRKRGERKAGPGSSWSKKGSGEPDSQ